MGQKVELGANFSNGNAENLNFGSAFFQSIKDLIEFKRCDRSQELVS